MGRLAPPSLLDVRAELCRRSLSFFIRQAWQLVEPGHRFLSNWHIDAISEYLEAVSRRDLRRLIITIPPRCMKSNSVSVFWPAWEWLTRPETRWLFASYGASLSTRDSLRCRRLILSTGTGMDDRDRTLVERIGYRGILHALYGDEPWELTGDQNAKTRFDNSRTGYRLSTSVGGAGTGEGGDAVVIDDPAKADEVLSDVVRESVIEWFDGTMSTRLNDPKAGVQVIIAQRLHEGDLIGHILERDKEHGEWETLCLPMEYEPEHPFVWPRDPRTKPGELLWPERFPRETVDSLKRQLGHKAAGQLQQRPSPAEGGLFKRAAFRYWKWVDEAHGILEFRRGETAISLGGVNDAGDRALIDVAHCVKFQTADTAATEKSWSDWTVIATWAVTPHRELLLLDVARDRIDTTKQSAWAVEQYDLHAPAWVGIEAKTYGLALFQTLRMLGYPCRRLEADRDKVSRAAVAGTLLENGVVYFPAHAEWRGEWEAELLAFPNGRHDDQVDVFGYAAIELPKITTGAADTGTGPPPQTSVLASESDYGESAATFGLQGGF